MIDVSKNGYFGQLIITHKGKSIGRYIFIRLKLDSYLYLFNPETQNNPELRAEIFKLNSMVNTFTTMRIDLKRARVSMLDDVRGERVLFLDGSGLTLWDDVPEGRRVC
jgi:hypothetical protein